MRSRGGWYFHGKIVLTDIAAGEAGFVKLDVGAGQDEREITVSCFSPYGPVEIDDLVAANWNTYSLHWDVMKVEGPVQPGCGLELVDDEQDPADGQLRVRPDDLAGDGLTISGTGCQLEVLPGCGVIVTTGVHVENSQLAGKGLTPGSGVCDLDVETGCGLHFFGNALEVDPHDLVGQGLLAGVGDCHLDVDISCGLEFDGNSIKVRTQDIAGAGLEGDLFQPGGCAVQIDFPVNCGLAFSVGDQLVVDMTQMTGPGIKTWTNPSGCVGVQLDHGCGLKLVGNTVEVDTQTLAGQGLNDLGGCQMSVLLGCNMQYGTSGKIEPDVASLAGDGLMVQAGICDKLKLDCNCIEQNCTVGGGGFTGAKQVVTAIECDLYDPYACPVAVIETWNFENGLLKSVV